jgi:hypothetical protein
MGSNKEDLSKLEKCLDTLLIINVSGCGDDLKNRLTKLSSWVISGKSTLHPDFVPFRNLKFISSDCKSLGEKSRFKRYYKSKEYKEKIQNIKASISSQIQEFTVRIVDVYHHPILTFSSLVLWQYFHRENREGHDTQRYIVLIIPDKYSD